MSIQGIGAKITVHKATDLSKEPNSQQKSGELMQAGLTRKAHEQTAAQSRQVQDVYEPSSAIINRENEKKDKRKQKQKKETKKRSKTPYSGQHKLDIQI